MDCTIARTLAITAAALALAATGCKPKTAKPEPVEAGERRAAEEQAAAPQTEEKIEPVEEPEAAERPLQGKKIVMVIPCQDFRDEELEIPRRVFLKKGAEVTVASTAKSGCKGMKGADVDPDVLLEDVVADDYYAMVFVGGSGSTAYYDDEQALELAREADKQGLVIGAICLAPGILAEAGILEGKHATAYDAPEAREALEQGGASYTGGKVTVDGVIVTANGPEAAQPFAEKLVEMIE
jgi:protease I